MVRLWRNRLSHISLAEIQNRVTSMEGIWWYLAKLHKHLLFYPAIPPSRNLLWRYASKNKKILTMLTLQKCLCNFNKIVYMMLAAICFFHHSRKYIWNHSPHYPSPMQPLFSVLLVQSSFVSGRTPCTCTCFTMLCYFLLYGCVCLGLPVHQ